MSKYDGRTAPEYRLGKLQPVKTNKYFRLIIAENLHVLSI